MLFHAQPKSQQKMKPFNFMDLNYNQLQLYCNKNASIYEYQIFTEFPLTHYIQELVNYFKEMDNVCLIEANDIVYLKKKLAKKVSLFKIGHPYSQKIEVTIKFRREIRKLKHCRKFFQTLFFTKIVDHLNDIGEPAEISDLNLSRLYNMSLTQGCWEGSVKMIDDNSNGIFLTYDVSHQITSQITLYEYMRREILKHQHHENCLEIVRQSFIGKTVMTRYNNKTYRIDDIDFATNPCSLFSSEEQELISFAKYYQTKYGIEIRHLSQPVIVHRIKIPNPENQNEHLSFVHCLLPELCYPVYNEWNPLGSNVYDEFNECLRCTPMVKEILSEWGFSLEPKLYNMPKPIFLFDTIKTAIASEEKKKSPWNFLYVFAR
ncbi:hypothetical protein PVAND_013438 [Polypedilum vanderplanki]|uniref:PAZ domain-containing protein n=1 Tax=Polypedilum vanderplanki TaxID=319348 RepID=A0A9J6CQP8_POLVA|nr:hypothetical protein PVAND_013438 [Polypedilum vanderplanki]